MRDTGVGLPAGGATRIFDAFYTTKRGGLGMGLSISRSIIEAHGGQLWASANRDRGTTFTFSLPRANRKRRRSTPEPGPGLLGATRAVQRQSFARGDARRDRASRPSASPTR